MSRFTHQVRRLLLFLIATALLAGAASAGVAANTGGFPGFVAGEHGELTAGPLGLNRRPLDGAVPVAIQIPDASVDTEVELNQIVDGVMQDPSGPWVVSWYQETAEVGDDGNSVMSGHKDYWDVGPAIFYTVEGLYAGAPITVTGEDGSEYRYEVEWVDTFTVADLTPETINDLVGPTDYAALTLITCGGAFDREAGAYLSRTVVRARLADSTQGAAPGLDADEEQPRGTGADLAVDVAAQPIDDVNLRQEPSIEAEVITTLSPDDELTITGEPVEADGIVWWPVVTAGGVEGWVAQDYIEAIE